MLSWQRKWQKKIISKKIKWPKATFFVQLFVKSNKILNLIFIYTNGIYLLDRFAAVGATLCGPENIDYTVGV